MFQPELTNEVPPMSVVGESFCFPYLVDLSAKKKISRFSEAHFDIFDNSGNLLLQVGGSIWQLNKKRVIRDPSGAPVLTIRGKLFDFRQRWTVHRGETKDLENLLFTVQQAYSFKLKRQLDVYLASNLTENLSDFHVTGSYLTESFKVHKGQQIIAEVKERVKVGCLVGKQKFEVRIYPGVDYALVVSLLVILNEIENGD